MKIVSVRDVKKKRAFEGKKGRLIEDDKHQLSRAVMNAIQRRENEFIKCQGLKKGPGAFKGCQKLHQTYPVPMEDRF